LSRSDNRAARNISGGRKRGGRAIGSLLCADRWPWTVWDVAGPSQRTAGHLSSRSRSPR